MNDKILSDDEFDVDVDESMIADGGEEFEDINEFNDETAGLLDEDDEDGEFDEDSEEEDEEEVEEEEGEEEDEEEEDEEEEYDEEEEAGGDKFTEILNQLKSLNENIALVARTSATPFGALQSANPGFASTHSCYPYPDPILTTEINRMRDELLKNSMQTSIQQNNSVMTEITRMREEMNKNSSNLLQNEIMMLKNELKNGYGNAQGRGGVFSSAENILLQNEISKLKEEMNKSSLKEQMSAEINSLKKEMDQKSELSSVRDEMTRLKKELQEAIDEKKQVESQHFQNNLSGNNRNGETGGFAYNEMNSNIHKQNHSNVVASNNLQNDKVSAIIKEINVLRREFLDSNARKNDLTKSELEKICQQTNRQLVDVISSELQYVANDIVENMKDNSNAVQVYNAIQSIDEQLRNSTRGLAKLTKEAAGLVVKKIDDSAKGVGAVAKFVKDESIKNQNIYKEVQDINKNSQTFATVQAENTKRVDIIDKRTESIVNMQNENIKTIDRLAKSQIDATKIAENTLLGLAKIQQNNQIVNEEFRNIVKKIAEEVAMTRNLSAKNMEHLKEVITNATNMSLQAIGDMSESGFIDGISKAVENVNASIVSAVKTMKEEFHEKLNDTRRYAVISDRLDGMASEIRDSFESAVTGINLKNDNLKEQILDSFNAATEFQVAKVATAIDDFGVRFDENAQRENIISAKTNQILEKINGYDVTTKEIASKLKEVTARSSEINYKLNELETAESATKEQISQIDLKVDGVQMAVNEVAQKIDATTDKLSIELAEKASSITEQSKTLLERALRVLGGVATVVVKNNKGILSLSEAVEGIMSENVFENFKVIVANESFNVVSEFKYAIDKQFEQVVSKIDNVAKAEIIEAQINSLKETVKAASDESYVRILEELDSQISQLSIKLKTYSVENNGVIVESMAEKLKTVNDWISQVNNANLVSNLNIMSKEISRIVEEVSNDPNKSISKDIQNVKTEVLEKIQEQESKVVTKFVEQIKDIKTSLVDVLGQNDMIENIAKNVRDVKANVVEEMQSIKKDMVGHELIKSMIEQLNKLSEYILVDKDDCTNNDLKAQLNEIKDKIINSKNDIDLKRISNDISDLKFSMEGLANSDHLLNSLNKQVGDLSIQVKKFGDVAHDLPATQIEEAINQLNNRFVEVLQGIGEIKNYTGGVNAYSKKSTDIRLKAASIMIEKLAELKDKAEITLNSIKDKEATKTIEKTMNSLAQAIEHSQKMLCIPQSTPSGQVKNQTMPTSSAVDVMQKEQRININVLPKTDDVIIPAPTNSVERTINQLKDDLENINKNINNQ